MRPSVLVRIIATVCAMWSAQLHAHTDTIIKLEGTRLEGLPPEYSPAELDLKALTLRIKDHRMVFSPYLRAFFEAPHPYEIEISASWYHNPPDGPTTLPPYLLLTIKPRKKDYHYTILLSLDSLDLIELSVVIETAPSTRRIFPIALDDVQKEQIRSSITKLK